MKYTSIIETGMGHQLIVNLNNAGTLTIAHAADGLGFQHVIGRVIKILGIYFINNRILATYEGEAFDEDGCHYSGAFAFATSDVTKSHSKGVTVGIHGDTDRQTLEDLMKLFVPDRDTCSQAFGRIHCELTINGSSEVLKQLEKISVDWSSQLQESESNDIVKHGSEELHKYIPEEEIMEEVDLYQGKDSVQLEIYLKSKKWHERILAYRKLGFTEEAKKDPDWYIRMKAYEALGWTEEALKDSDKKVRDQAKLKLQQNNTFLAQFHYQGTRDMSIPLPEASEANKGWYYVANNVKTANGYSTGDLVVSNGTSWGKIDRADAFENVVKLWQSQQLTSC